MKKVILWMTIFLLFFPLKIDAASCTKGQIQRYEKLANQIQTTYDYVENNNGVLFTITFHNVYEDLYLVDYTTFGSLTTYKNKNNGTIEVSGYEPNKNYTFHVLNNNTLCDTKIISKINVTLPFYNSYYKDPLCEGIETYSLCQKWNNIGKMSRSEFEKSIKEYKIKLEVEDNEDSNIVIEDTIWNQIRNFVANYYIYIITIVILITIVIIYVIQKRKKRLW